MLIPVFTFKQIHLATKGNTGALGIFAYWPPKGPIVVKGVTHAQNKSLKQRRQKSYLSVGTI